MNNSVQFLVKDSQKISSSRVSLELSRFLSKRQKASLKRKMSQTEREELVSDDIVQKMKIMITEIKQQNVKTAEDKDKKKDEAVVTVEDEDDIKSNKEKDSGEKEKKRKRESIHDDAEERKRDKKEKKVKSKKLKSEK